MRRLVIGDIHGSLRALKQAFERASFDYKEDLLICLGDVADGWPDVKECFEELLKVKNLIFIMGNHDMWLLRYLQVHDKPNLWTSQGGGASVESYKTIKKTRLPAHIKLLKEAKPYYVSEDNKLFVHGGYNKTSPIEAQDPSDLMWDRDLLYSGVLEQVRLQSNDFIVDETYDEIFVGHTATTKHLPLSVGNMWALDQGCGWDGKLTIMDVDTKEYWQSDLCPDLYPEVKGRR